MWDPGLSCAQKMRQDEEDQRQLFCLPCSSRASDLLFVSPYECASIRGCVSVCVCGCVCAYAECWNREERQNKKMTRNNIFTLEEALWLAQTICCFIMYSAPCLSARTTNIVKRKRYKRSKVGKHWASSKLTQTDNPSLAREVTLIYF